MSNLSNYELAALASDSYHRGYHAGMPDMDGEDGEDDGLGSDFLTAAAGGAVIASSKDLDDDRLDIAADFYAVAYLINGEVVISYRGSDNLFGEDAYRVSALWNGQAPDQLLLALEFFNHVRDLYPSAPITLTGHSLGGALAGAVATLKNVDAVIFDNTAFEAAAANIASKITSTQADFDQALFDLVYDGAATPWSSFGTGNISAIALESDIAGYFRVGRIVDDVDMGTPLLPQDAHMMGLLVLALYARSHYGADGAWLQAANAVFTQLSSDAIALAIGIDAAHDNPGSGVMKDMIASTVLPGDDNPFGGSAAGSLTNDMQDLGMAATSGVNLSTMAGLIVRYAALQAKYAISESTSSGFLTYDSGSWLLGADLTQAKWTFDEHVASMEGGALDFSGYLTDKTLDSTEIASLDHGPSRFEYEFYSTAVGGWQGQVGFESEDYTVKVVGTDTLDTIIGTDGDEQFLLGDGNDTVKANGGVNWIDGGAGDDTLIDDNAWADFEITLDFGRYYFALRDSGADPRIHILDNMELFKLDGQDFDATNILNVAPTDVFISELIGDTNNNGFLPGAISAGTVIANLCAVDGNEHDRLTWEILGTGSNFYTIDANGVLKASVAFTYNYLYWYAQVGAVTYSEWQAGDLTTGFSDLLGTQYGVTVRVTDAAGESIERDVFLYLENIYNTVVGTPQNDTLVGGAGQSFIAGLGGADTITDNDWLVLDYSASNTGVRIYVGQTSGRMDGKGGHAEGDIIGLNRNARLDIIGSDFDDVLNGTSPGSWNYGHMLNGDNAIFGGAGNDIINAGGGTNWLYGGDGNDTITGAGGYDEIYGGDGYDIINAGGGENYVDFGTGGGELKLPDYYQPYYANLETREFHYLNGQAWTTTTVVGDFDRLTGTNYSDEIHGSADSDKIYGGGGPNDQIYGWGGNDYLEGAGSIYGGSGDDTIVLTGIGTAWGGSDNDTITANTSGSTIYGGQGINTLSALATGITIVGGEGVDTISFYAYNSVASSTLSYFDSPEGITVRTVGNKVYGFGGDAEGDVVSGSFKLIGTNYGDDIRLAGFSSMEVRAGGGDDYIAIDMKTSITIYGGSGEDEIHLNRGQTAYGEADDDTFYGVGKMYGGDGNDEFYLYLDYYTQFTNKFWAGGTVDGGAGSNTIHGGGGDDAIAMAAGANTFIFATGGRKDTVTGAGLDDVIRLDGILAFSSMSDVSERLQQVGTNVLFDLGKMSDHQDVYGANAPADWIGSIQFNSMTIAQVSALSWEFV